MRTLIAFTTTAIFAAAMYTRANTVLDGSSYSTGTPFLARSAPALISAQPGSPSAVKISYRLDDAAVSYAAAATATFSSSAVAVLYEPTSVESWPLFCGAFSQRVDRLHAGGSLTVQVADKPALAAGISFAYEIIDSVHIGLNAGNLMLTQTGPAVDHPAFSMVVGGRVPKMRRTWFDVDANIKMIEPRLRDFATELSALLARDFFMNPVLNTGVGFEAAFDRSTVTGASICGSIGLHARLGGSVAGVFCAYRHDFKGRESGPSLALYLNPSLTVATRSFSLDLSVGSAGTDTGFAAAGREIIISIRCRGDRDCTPVETWAVAIMTDAEDDKSTVRVFAGGSTPPSSIVWDGYDGNGAQCGPGTYHIRIVAVDRAGKRIASSWKKIVVR